MAAPPTVQEPAATAFAAQLGRTVDRLRSLSLARLAAPFEPGPTRADAGHALAQQLADDAAALAGERVRAVPRLADGAVGDQVAVCGHDLLVAASARAGDPHAAAVLTGRAQDLLDLRRAL